VARLHSGQIRGGFLSLLGPSFLSHLYRRICLSPGSFLMVAEDNGGVVGFVAGSADVGALYRDFLVHDGLRVAWASAGRLLRHWRSALETLRHGTGSDGPRGSGVELLAIAVDPGRQGEGVGESLIRAFLDRATGDGRDAAHVVVAADNVGAVRFYGRAGFVVAGRFELHAGTVSLLMQWRRPPDGGPSS
jgi:ribosomal protein S18 acetylase RimI-like enzyme